MKILSVAGARPNFIKIAPLLKEMGYYPQIESILVHTGQHYSFSMSEQFFKDLNIPEPEVNLEVGSGSHSIQTAEIMKGIEPVLEHHRPDVVMVVGDVNSTLAATITAVKLGIPVAHVEAGLRSFDRTMPEEINRVVTDAISNLLFVTEESGVENLLREGVPREKIHFVGNVMIDALEIFRPQWEASTILHRLRITLGEPYAVLTLHRPSNVDDPVRLKPLLEKLCELSCHLPMLFPVHPRVKAQLVRYGNRFCSDADLSTSMSENRIMCLDPLGYLDFIALVSRARLVLTDSGGIQEETTALGIPCLTLRNTTERPVTVTHGTNRVIGTDPARISNEALRSLEHPPQPKASPPLWDGQASVRIVKHLVESLGKEADARPRKSI